MLDVERLSEILTACMDETEDMRLGEHPDDLLSDRGVDSLAVLEAVAVLRSEYGAPLTYDETLDARTPRALVELVNSKLTATRS